ncbi:Uncharacterised protein [Bordetella pertussis]|nr:Uncharacterised protein [Bordetella pertussis]
MPVPVAPVMQPCRLASAGSSASSVWAFLAITMGSGITALRKGAKSDAQV